MSNVKGKKIWLVGASEGIGEALARLLAAEGALIAISARSQDKIAVLAASLTGQNHLALPVDVTQMETVRKAWADLNEAWGGVDIVLYNAGTYDPLNGSEFDLVKTEKMLDVNFRGALRVLDCIIPHFVAKRGGHIVLVGSVAAYSGLPNAIGYGASKAALLHLTENLKLDLAKHTIKVQLVSPGFVKTRLTEKNSFPMPFMISAELAAERIVQGMQSCRFEIHFPKRFTYLLKFLRLLPYCLYFRITKNLG